MPGKLLLYKGRAAGQDNTVLIPSLVPGVAFFPSPSVGVVLRRDGASSLEALRVTFAATSINHPPGVEWPGEGPQSSVLSDTIYHYDRSGPIVI